MDLHTNGRRRVHPQRICGMHYKRLVRIPGLKALYFSRIILRKQQEKTGLIHGKKYRSDGLSAFQKGAKFKKVINWFFLFTMIFSGGMIPTYLVVKELLEYVL